MPANQPETIRVLAYRDGDMWVAQCVEFDISTQADDCDTAMRRLEVVMRAECDYTKRRHGKVFANIDAAPDWFGERFDELTQSLHHENMEYRIAA